MIKKVTQKEVDKARSESWYQHRYQWYEVDRELAGELQLGDTFEEGTVRQITITKNQFFVEVMFTVYD